MINVLLLLFGICFTFSGMFFFFILITQEMFTSATFVIPITHFFVGILFLVIFFIRRRSTNEIIKKGKEYRGVIIGYTDDGDVDTYSNYKKRVVVRFFDYNGKVKETILSTGKLSPEKTNPGDSLIFKSYKGRNMVIEGSHRSIAQDGDNKLKNAPPISLENRTVVSVYCTACGSTFRAIHGYDKRCAYCGRIIEGKVKKNEHL